MAALPNTEPSVNMPAIRRAVYKRLLLSVLMSCGLFFLPAGSLRFWQAWLFMAVMFAPMLLMFAYLIKHDPALLARRMQWGEKRPAEQRFMVVSSVYFLALFIIPGLDYRFGWSAVPIWLIIAADLIFLVGYGLFALTLRENSYASRIVEVVEGQKVIDTGPYAVIRHPMYVAVIVMYVAAPLALGSWWALLAAAPLPFLIAYRILDEERTLVEELPGYTAYRQKVRYRLIPYVW